ncbi:PREDICTED: fibrinogen-like protein 1, partial [Merops nubicus]|uniref:fibrinogen-like protein 1 n=1 Tax=Merops nubicus TaxID=57421 RepID=UPI0004F00256
APRSSLPQGDGKRSSEKEQPCVGLKEEDLGIARVWTKGSGQREALRDIVIDALRFLEQQKGFKPVEVSLKEAVNMIRVRLSQLEEGYQPAARTFQCATCDFVDCPFPLDCPVQDVWVHADEPLMLSCDVPFATPRDPPVTWMVASDLRTRDLTLFEELQGSVVDTPRLTLPIPPLGTVACLLGNLSEPLVRKFFYLNGEPRVLDGRQHLFLAALGHSMHVQNLNIFKKSPSNASASALKKTDLPKDCSEVQAGRPSGGYIIQPTGLHPMVVYCEMSVAGGRWTVIQRNQQDTHLTWAESWSTYKHGFGNVHTEYWLGTEYIHQISKQKVYQVRFIIWDASNSINFADYNFFSVDDESQGYRLRLGTYSGTAGDAMDSDNPKNVHNNMKFSTKDRDQDTSRGNCASRSGGGWWYSACYAVRLNVKGGMTWGTLCKGNCRASAILIKPAPDH